MSDAAARRRLNAIVHPLVARVVADRCAALAGQGHETVIVEAALLAENGVREAWLDGLIVVTCPAEARRQRLVEQRGMTPGQAQQRIDAQTPPETKAALADWFIENEGTLDDLEAGVARVAHALRPAR